MKKRGLRWLSVLLAAVFAFSVLPVFAGAQEAAEEVREQEYCPTIVIPGLFQSKVRLYAGDGSLAVRDDGEEYEAPFFMESTESIVKLALKKVFFPMMMTLLTQKDPENRFANALADAIGEVLCGNIHWDGNGNLDNSIRADWYDGSFAELSEEEQNHILSAVPMQEYIRIAGEDHLYFFSYYSLDNMQNTADKLYDYIAKVKQDAGSDKVNLVSISQGGSIANMLLDMYREKGRSISEDVNRIIYVVPALNGSSLLGEIYQNGVLDDDEALYGYMFPELMGEDGYLVNLLIRFLPKKVLNQVLDAAFTCLIDEHLKYSTLLWGLIPMDNYEKSAELYLSDPQDSAIRAQTDRYYQAQCRSRQNILDAVADGVQVFDIVGYNHALYPLIDSWDDVNADGIIQLDSSSMGAYSRGVDVPLGESYVPQNPNCSDPSHNHRDPAGVLDASVGLLPEQTFYFYGQDHERTGDNDAIMQLAVALLTDSDFTSVHSYPERFPQFNNARNTASLRRNVAAMQEYDRTGLDADVSARLDSAIQGVNDVLANPAADPAQLQSAADSFYAVRQEITGEQPPQPKQQENGGWKQSLSGWVYDRFGARGWFDAA